MENEIADIQFYKGLPTMDILNEWGAVEGHKIIVFDDLIMQGVESEELVQLMCVEQITYILKTLTTNQVQVILEILYNVIKGVCPISKKNKTALMQRKRLIREVLRPDLTLNQRRRQLQKLKKNYLFSWRLAYIMARELMLVPKLKYQQLINNVKTKDETLNYTHSKREEDGKDDIQNKIPLHKNEEYTVNKKSDESYVRMKPKTFLKSKKNEVKKEFRSQKKHLKTKDSNKLKWISFKI
ncbi:unnamed protein product [Mytilus edulis]|nr:unnamed protein product [Mytilus edulis]